MKVVYPVLLLSQFTQTVHALISLNPIVNCLHNLPVRSPFAEVAFHLLLPLIDILRLPRKA